MIVKICGITRLEDAWTAVDAGASAIGFIFWPASPRFIDPYRARAIAAALPPFVTTVGVFVDQPLEHLSSVANLVRLAALQLHGAETPAYASALGRPVIKAMTLAEATAQSLDDWPRPVTILLDAGDPIRRGGTGRPIDWTAVTPIAARRPVLLAGGLTPENVGTAVTCARPFGIDVSSGVERSPGVKDHARVRALFRAIEGLHADSFPARS
jgi:phosphoribosylanthranilate isomerase